MAEYNPFTWAIAKYITECIEITQEQALTVIEIPHSSTVGVSYAVPVSRTKKFVKFKSNPNEMAKEWAEKFVANEWIAKATSDRIYVNFTVQQSRFLSWSLRGIWIHGSQWRVDQVGTGKKVVVEYSSPNIAKPFHAGHLRSTIIGKFLCSILQYQGYNVHSINYLGDWGKQYGLLALGFERFGNEEALVEDPIKHLFHVYVEINKAAKADESIHEEARKYFKKMEDGDEKYLAVWNRFRSLSIEKYTQLYDNLGIQFDEYSGESQYSEQMEAAFESLVEKGLVFEDQGAQLVDLSDVKLGKVLVKKSDGGSLYMTRDIAAAVDRYQRFKFDKMYYVVSSAQDHHFKQLFAVLKKLGHGWVSNCHHINFGLVLGMSTRKGNVAFLEDIVASTDEAMMEVLKMNEEKAAEISNCEQTSHAVSLSALFIQDFGAKRNKNYQWDLARSTSPEGDTGPYLQYTHARLASIARKVSFTVDIDEVDFDGLTEPILLDIALFMVQWPDIIRAATEQVDPCKVVTYAIKLCHLVSHALVKIYVVSAEEKLGKARLALFKSAQMIIQGALKLLGLTPLERI